MASGSSGDAAPTAGTSADGGVDEGELEQEPEIDVSDLEAEARSGPTLTAEGVQSSGVQVIKASYILSADGEAWCRASTGERLKATGTEIHQYRKRDLLHYIAQYECDIRKLGKDIRVGLVECAGATRTSVEGRKVGAKGRSYFTKDLSTDEPCREAGRALVTCMLLAGATQRALQGSQRVRGRHFAQPFCAGCVMLREGGACLPVCCATEGCIFLCRLLRRQTRRARLQKQPHRRPLSCRRAWCVRLWWSVCQRRS